MFQMSVKGEALVDFHMVRQFSEVATGLIYTVKIRSKNNVQCCILRLNELIN